MDGQTQVSGWIAAAKARGSAPFLLSLLEAIEPIAPALAAGLLVAGPLAGFWPGAAGLRALADMLDEPAGIQRLRRELADEGLE